MRGHSRCRARHPGPFGPSCGDSDRKLFLIQSEQLVSIACDGSLLCVSLSRNCNLWLALNAAGSERPLHAQPSSPLTCRGSRGVSHVLHTTAYLYSIVQQASTVGIELDTLARRRSVRNVQRVPLAPHPAAHPALLLRCRILLARPALLERRAVHARLEGRGRGSGRVGDLGHRAGQGQGRGGVLLGCLERCSGRPLLRGNLAVADVDLPAAFCTERAAADREMNIKRADQT
jgi:hypothetical protein